MSRAVADALMAVFGYGPGKTEQEIADAERAESRRAFYASPVTDAERAAFRRRLDTRPAEAACSCGSRHAGTVATARVFTEEHRTCAAMSGGKDRR